MSNNRIDISKNNIYDFQSRLLYITYSQYGEDWKSLMHLHPFVEIFYVIGGKGKFSVENETFDVKANDMIIVNPNVYHHEDSDINDLLEYVVLGVEELTFHLNEKDNTFFYQSFEDDKDDIQYYINRLLIESERKFDGYEAICQKLSDVFLLLIVRKVRLGLSQNGFQKPVKREVRMICHYIDHNYSNDISLEFLAEYMNINKYYLAHEFKKHMGVSPINYLIDRRITECKSLLRTTSFSIAEISEAVGFSSQSYFSQIFKKHTQMTPKEFRDKKIEDEHINNDALPGYQKKYIFNIE